ncbi:beta-lactamase hydrolase domain-containing protein [Hyphobacterium marinum]|uniref:Sulfur transferase domain-containing protein n=1 Tax=Hyphobacterium marinum TaxID=3116574 RepID=A0ABU7LX48_9PROT|nr:sulfur transferase domain-containing protein [Hyphobacterium sp. Y6023]MEE2566118.1 sulfur transferase domain-containing protein [Hyphobacterium sp. Y6023]
MKLLLTVMSAFCLMLPAAIAQDAEPLPPRVVAIDGNVWIAGQPSEAMFAAWAEAGATTVVNLRTARENGEVSFDGAVAAAEHGLAYSAMETGYEAGYSPEMVAALTDILDAAQGPVVLHCASGTRAANLYTAYRIERGDLAPEDAAEAHLAPHTDLNPEIMRMLSPRYAAAFPAE